MKNHLLYTIIFLFLCSGAFAQVGMWTWISGTNIATGGPVFGTQGVPGPLNHPAGLYEACEWTDQQGNFWLFGGQLWQYNDLWKYDPSVNQWTWVKGTGSMFSTGNYGIKGVSALSNQPPGRAYGALTWVDTTGDLWMYGGAIGPNESNDLWRYNIASNIWTWMNGDSVTGQPPVYGTLGMPGPNNTPGARAETSVTWVDSNNNFWLFGGIGGFGHFNDLWKYDPSVNQWTWMKGANFGNQAGIYGIMGVPDTANVPGARMAYSHWKDSAGNFWLFGGSNNATSLKLSDMWMYNISTNLWTWMNGPSTPNDTGHYGIQCIPQSLNLPCNRFETRACWTDTSGNFWMYGGEDHNFILRGDLWMFNPDSLQWTFASGDTIANPAPVYGTKGVAAPLNKPGGRCGALGWYNSINNSLYMYGGVGSGSAYYGDMWRYQIDPNCPPNQNSLPTVNISSTDTTFCEKQCINFFDLSTNNPTSWQWFFPGSDSLTSTLQNPTNICYNSYGIFDVTLIACNAAGCDTLHLTNFITCYQNPTDSIYQSNDTLFSLPAYAYQWYEVTNGIIAGATNQYFVPQQAGSYYCVVTDSIGCAGSSGTIVITATNQISNFQFPISIFPNPNDGSFEIVLNDALQIKNYELKVYDAFGRIVFSSKPEQIASFLAMTGTMNVKLNLENGIYLVEVIKPGKIFRQKMIVQN
ncbi:MAG: kelch repeat-containing protein [Bacteroidia bacterium]